MKEYGKSNGVVVLIALIRLISPDKKKKSNKCKKFCL